MMYQASTQILTPSSLTMTLSGTAQNQSETTYSLCFLPYQTENQITNEMSLAGSGVAGQYFGGIPSKGNPSTRLTLGGSGGGNLPGLANVIFFNLHGSLEVIAKNDETNQAIGSPSLLQFSGLLQLTMNGEQADLCLVNPYAEIQNPVIGNGKITFSSIELSDPVISVTCSQCLRYVLIGQFNLTFTL